MRQLNHEQKILHYQAKLQHEIDAWDLYQLFCWRKYYS